MEPTEQQIGRIVPAEAIPQALQQGRARRWESVRPWIGLHAAKLGAEIGSLVGVLVGFCGEAVDMYGQGSSDDTISFGRSILITFGGFAIGAAIGEGLHVAERLTRLRFQSRRKIN